MRSKYNENKFFLYFINFFTETSLKVKHDSV